MGLSSQSGYQDFSVVGMGRRPRREGKRGRGRVGSTIFYSLLPPLSWKLLDSYLHQPFPSFPLCYQTEAMFSSKDSCPSLLGGLNAFLPNQPSQLGFHPFPAPKWTSQNAGYPGWNAGAHSAGAAPGAFPLLTWMLRIPKTGMKAFKKNRSLRKLFCISILNGLHGTRAKDDNVFIQVLEQSK